METKAIVLLSGGLDSTTALAIAISTSRRVVPLAFDYKQRHRREISSAHAVVAHFEARGCSIEALRVVSLVGLDLPGSALTSDTNVPTGRSEKEMTQDIPVTYVPARNSVFLAIGASLAEALGADEVWAGYNCVDYSGYPDCRPEYVQAMQEALARGTKRGVQGDPIKLVAPIITDDKVTIVKKALSLHVPLELTWSCYNGQDRPCGACDSCLIRRDAFERIGVEDPARW